MKKFYIYILFLFLFLMLSLPSALASDFWQETYQVKNIDVLQQRIHNLKDDNFKYDELYKLNYFYDVDVITENNNYTLRFNVWAKNKNASKNDIIKDLIFTADNILLKEQSFKDHIRIKIEFYSEDNQYIKSLYDDFIK